jgi:hypothetical protein
MKAGGIPHPHSRVRNDGAPTAATTAGWKELVEHYFFVIPSPGRGRDKLREESLLSCFPAKEAFLVAEFIPAPAGARNGALLDMFANFLAGKVAMGCNFAAMRWSFFSTAR